MNQYSEESLKYRQGYNTSVLKSRMFGAFIEAVKSRRNTERLNQKRLSENLGTTETNVSKLVSGPRNWRLSTIAEILLALDLDIEFAFVDRKDRNHIFTDMGEKHRNWEAEFLFRQHTYQDENNIQVFISKYTPTTKLTASDSQVNYAPNFGRLARTGIVNINHNLMQYSVPDNA